MITLKRGVTDRLLDAVWDAVNNAEYGEFLPLPGSRGQLAAYLFPWVVVGGYTTNGECVGAVWFKGKEIHIALRSRFHKKWANKTLLRQFFRAFFAQSDVAETWADTDAGRRFDRAAGFTEHETVGGRTRFTLRREDAKFL